MIQDSNREKLGIDQVFDFMVWTSSNSGLNDQPKV